MTIRIGTRHNRRTWLAALLVAVGCLVAVAGGAAKATAATPAATSLSAAFDNVGINTASGPAANFDGVGDGFTASGIAADGLRPGARLLHDGISLTWPQPNASGDDNVLADGQTIALAGSGNRLGVVAASAFSASGGGVSGTFTVNYADGSSTTGTLAFGDWADNAPASGTDLLATSEGTGSGLSAPVALYYGSIPLDPSKTVASVTLPTIGDAVGDHISALHVFDLAIGTAGAQATGAPGAESYYDLGRKDCVGTAENTESKVWYTVADGSLSDVYAPTIDNTDVKSLDTIVTGSDNGTAFTDLQPRDMTYTVSQLGESGMACRVVAVPKDDSQHFAVVTDFITDPVSDAVVMQVSLVRLTGAASDLHLYLRFNPLLNGHGGGGSQNVGGQSATIFDAGSHGEIPVAYSTNSFTEATNRSYATPIYAALAASTPFDAVETGYVGAASDGLTELDNGQQLTSTAPDADNGNVVQTVELSFDQGPGGRQSPVGSVVGSAAVAAAVSAASGDADVSAADVSSTTVALGFGQHELAAIHAAQASAAAPFVSTYEQYQGEWETYDAGLRPPPTAVAGAPGAEPAAKLAQAYWLSANVLKASEDKTFIGDTAASLASPWGQAVPAGNGNGSDNLASYFGSYREVFPRDAYETFTGFLADGDLSTARDMVRFWFGHLQLANGSFPRNGLVNGQAAPDTAGLQLDETADPILAAWQAGLSGDATLYNDHIRAAADFLVANGPETSGSVERWEEQNGYSPSTMADEVAGLVAASAIARQQGDAADARVYAATADDFRDLILKTTVVTGGTSPTGQLLSGPYFIRLSKDGDPGSDPTYQVGNGNGMNYPQNSVIDQGFLELVRQGELGASAPAVQDTLAIAGDPANGSGIYLSTPSGTGILRYTGDGYGDCFPASEDTSGVTPDDSPANQNCPTPGAPWADTDQGTGHPWPVLSGENGEYQISDGATAAAVADLNFMLKSASGVGLVPEQIWDGTDVPAGAYPADPVSGAGSDPASAADPRSASIGFVDGQADGSAAPLTWAQAQELRLIADLGSGSLGDQAAIVAQRYAGVSGDQDSSPVPLQVTAPLQVAGGNVPPSMVRPAAAVDGPTTITGTTAPGATVDVAVTQDPDGSGTTTASTVGATTISTVTADAGGAFAIPVTLPAGTDAVEVTATVGAGDAPSQTNEALFTLDQTLPAGDLVLDAPAAADGGSGPGTYVYPTATNGDGSPTFPADSFRLGGLRVVNSADGSTTIAVEIANLRPIFGALLGGQLLDIYIHAPSAQVPAGELQSTGSAATGSSETQDNYTITPAGAWNQLLQIDAGNVAGVGDFGQDKWVTPDSTSGGIIGSVSLGDPAVSITQLGSGTNGETPGVVDITLPDASLGTPGPGWTFTVALTGQGGTDSGNDVAYPRSFTAGPSQWAFGVCSSTTAQQASPPAICSANPGRVPNVLDTIPPAGDSVQSELTPVGGQEPALMGVTIGS